MSDSPIPELSKEQVVKGLKESLKKNSKNELVRIAIQLIFDKHNLEQKLKDQDNG